MNLDELVIENDPVLDKISGICNELEEALRRLNHLGYPCERIKKALNELYEVHKELDERLAQELLKKMSAG